MRQQKQNKILHTPVSDVMTVYNEKHHIADLVSRIHSKIILKLPKGSEFIIYADSPTDGTDKLLKSIAKKYNFNFSCGKKNLGYAQATKHILSLAKNPLIFYTDSSGKHEPQDFWKLITKIKEFDIVTGQRVSKGNPFIRRLVSFLQQILVTVIFRVPMLDYNAGFKIIKKEVAQAVAPKCKYLKQSFSSELLLRAQNIGYSICQVPVHFGSRPGINTGTNYKQLPKIIIKQLRGYLELYAELRK